MIPLDALIKEHQNLINFLFLEACACCFNIFGFFPWLEIIVFEFYALTLNFFEAILNALNIFYLD